MKKIFILPCIVFISLNASGQQAIKKIIVKFKEAASYQIDYSKNKITLNNEPADNVFSKNNVSKITSLFGANQKAAATLKSTELIKNIQFMQFATDKPVAAIISELNSTGMFEYVEEDYVGSGSGVRSITPNDNYFTRQWGLYNNGTFNAQATAGADVKMKDAWSVTTGNASTIVCVLDCGAKMDHPEFAGRIWVNAGEIPNNGIDDDNNGYTDDVNGWDWANNDKDPTDDYGHGTNVAGIIGANANNSNGYAGVNWNCKLMVGKELDNNNQGFYSWWISGIYYAVANGAKIINMSEGGTGFSQAMKDACDFAYNNNVTVLAAMMNDNSNVVYYPAGYSSTIAVGATSSNDHRANPFVWGGGSNYGPHIDVVGPGNIIYGLQYNSNTGYDTYWSGTSQATPLVAGIVSLLYVLKPAITVDQVRTILRTTATDLVGDPAEDTPGFDQYMGYGRVNAAAALNSSLLPLTTGSLTGRLVQDKVQLVWQTFQEFNIVQFEIEHSVNLVTWNTAGVATSGGNTNTGHSYSWNDNTVQYGANYYRLKIVEKDGSFSYSNIFTIKQSLANKIALVSALVKNEIKLDAQFKASDQANYFVYSITGALMLNKKLAISAGNTVLLIAINLPAGVYAIKITTSSGQLLLLEKFIKQ